MYHLELLYFKSSESKYPDECFYLHYLKGQELDFAELYNLQEEVSGGEIDYKRETNIDEVRKWLEDGIIKFSYPWKGSRRFDETVLSDPSPILVIEVHWGQNYYD